MNDESYSPEWAPHVVGTWPARTDPLEGQLVRIACSFPGCGGTYQVRCMTGAVRAWVSKFARVHFHGDPLDPAHQRRMAEARNAKR